MNYGLPHITGASVVVAVTKTRLDWDWTGDGLEH